MRLLKTLILIGAAAFLPAYGQSRLEYGTRYRMGGNASNNRVVELSNGNVAVAWYSEPGFHVLLYSNGGDPVGEVHLWTSRPNSRVIPLKTDGFYILYSDGDDLKAILYSASGSVIGSVFTVNSRVNVKNANLDDGVVALGNGDVVCIYTGVVRGEYPFRYESCARRLGPSGGAIGDEMTVSGLDPDWTMPVAPRILAIHPDLFAVLWSTHAWNWPQKLMARLFDAGMNPRTDPIEIASDTEAPRFECWNIPGQGFRVFYKAGSSLFTRYFSAARFGFDGAEAVAQNVQSWVATASGGDRNALLWLWRDDSSDYYYLEARFGVDSTMRAVSGIQRIHASDLTITGIEDPVVGLLPTRTLFGWVEKDGVYGQFMSGASEKFMHRFKLQGRTRFPSPSPTRILATQSGDFYLYWIEYDPEYATDTFYIKRFSEKPLRHDLSEFDVLRPVNDSYVDVTNPDFFWRPASRGVFCYPWEVTYTLSVDVQPDFPSPARSEREQDTTLTVRGLHPGTTYFWRVSARNFYGDSLWSSNTNAFFVSHSAQAGIQKDLLSNPVQFKLTQNFPNPFNSTTLIRFKLPLDGTVDVSVIDLSGRRVDTLIRESRIAGEYSTVWNGLDSSGNPVPSGNYVCRMEVRAGDGNRFVRSIKMGLVR